MLRYLKNSLVHVFFQIALETMLLPLQNLVPFSTSLPVTIYSIFDCEKAHEDFFEWQDKSHFFLGQSKDYEYNLHTWDRHFNNIVKYKWCSKHVRFISTCFKLMFQAKFSLWWTACYFPAGWKLLLCQLVSDFMQVMFFEALHGVELL